MEFLPGFGPDALQYATVALNLALALLAGAGLSQTWLLAASSPWAVRSLRRSRRVAIGALALALLASCAVLWLEAAAMAEVPLREAGPAAWSVVSATHRGFAWMLGMGALALAAAALALRGRGSRARARAAGMVGLLAVGVFLYSRSIVSHAASGDAGWAVLADWLHLVFISMWVGDVFVSGLVVLPLAPGSVGHARHEAARYIEALSRSATLALAGIVVTGLLGAWRSLGSLENMTGNPYADILLAKLALVAAAAVLGGVNRLFVMPGLLAQLRGSGPTAGARARRFTAILQFEALILLAALVLAAILSSTPPPGAG